RIGEGLEQMLPNLKELILTNNSIMELGDLDNLSTFKNLTYLSLLRNPVINKRHYRLYVVFRLPQIRVLDFQKIRQKNAIANATTLAEVERLKGLLQSGQIPGKDRTLGNEVFISEEADDEEMEEEMVANGS
ncbi:hypothetical protein AB205_0128860, partial [Aquarana catesbeiana]